MSETFLVLERAVQADLDTIARLYAEIGQPGLPEDAPQDQLIVLSYRLHNLYNAFENIFRNVAAVFENHVDEAAGWHSQLLRHMRLDLTPVRPALIDESAYEKLDELRRFRHLFRSAYGVQLDANGSVSCSAKRFNCVGSTCRRWNVSWNSCALCSNNVESTVHATRLLRKPPPVPRSAITSRTGGGIMGSE